MVCISGDNEDLTSVMDVDGDGNVEPEEMDLFYRNYDLNGDGVLQDEEIESALD